MVKRAKGVNAPTFKLGQGRYLAVLIDLVNVLLLLSFTSALGLLRCKIYTLIIVGSFKELSLNKKIMVKFLSYYLRHRVRVDKIR